MGILLENFVSGAVCILALIGWLFYWYVTRNYQYWKKRAVPYKKPSFPFGSLNDAWFARTFSGNCHFNIYKEFPNERYYGVLDFMSPKLVIKDPELIKNVLVKDFYNFMDKTVMPPNRKDHFPRNLLNLVGQEWKDTRSKLTPTFSSGKMKQIFEIVDKCSKRLKHRLEIDGENGNTVDVKNIFSRFTLDAIGLSAFGLDVNSLFDEKSTFYKTFGVGLKKSLVQHILQVVIVTCLPLLKILHVDVNKLAGCRKEWRDLARNLVKDTIEYRQKQNVMRNDFIDLMLNINNPKSEQKGPYQETPKLNNCTSIGMTLEEMTTHSLVFIFAGFEGSSSLMTFCLYELSCHKDVQQKLFREIRETVGRHGGRVTYQALMEMTFLEQVLNETLRLHGPAQALSRFCTQPYKVPDSDLVLEKGVEVIIPVYSLHHDPQYFPDPYKFDPERFTQEEINKRHSHVFLPFGEGPRICIGMRFAMMQAKIGITTVVLNFLLELAPEQEVPIEIDKMSLPIMPANPVKLKVHRRV